MRPRAQHDPGRPAGAIQVNTFEPSFDARAGEDDDRVGAFERVLDDEVAAGERKKAGQPATASARVATTMRTSRADPLRRLARMLKGLSRRMWAPGEVGAAAAPPVDVRM